VTNTPHRTSRAQSVALRRRAVKAALPVVVGYIALGVPCGILGVQAGLSILQMALLSIILYSGSGQFMIASMWLGGLSPVTIGISVALVNSRQLLYASSLVPRFRGEDRTASLLAAANITDETFGVNTAEYGRGDWHPRQVFIVNCCSQASWTLSNVVGALIGSIWSIDLGVASFAMTSIFVCLLLMQRGRGDFVIAGVGAAIGVVTCKLIGLANVAILVGALIGVACGFLSHGYFAVREAKTRARERHRQRRRAAARRTTPPGKAPWAATSATTVKQRNGSTARRNATRGRRGGHGMD
jgi:4-azaleucine resistance transporter AzlC